MQQARPVQALHRRGGGSSGKSSGSAAGCDAYKHLKQAAPARQMRHAGPDRSPAYALCDKRVSDLNARGTWAPYVAFAGARRTRTMPRLLSYFETSLVTSLWCMLVPQVDGKFRGSFVDDLFHGVRLVVGRVNLIGEHIDYEGYPVLPMAIEKDTIVAIASTTDTTNIELVNVDGRKFPGVQMDVDEGQKVEFSSTGWGSYFLCGYKGVFDYLRENQLDIPKTRYGLRVVVHGRVPTGAGVSSSSAFVCASVLAVMGVYGLDFPPETVAEIARVCEHCRTSLINHLPCSSRCAPVGGMDQAISLLGERGVAKLISFNPIKAVDVKLPSGTQAGSIANPCCMSLVSAGMSRCERDCRLLVRRGQLIGRLQQG
eukprot:scaffold38_cov415-Prasinococcus_capsulatus_cf.AAC.6